jgi:hypothetical protein
MGRRHLFGSLSEALGEEVTVATPMATLLRYAEKHDGRSTRWR